MRFIMIKIITESGEWKEIQDIEAYAKTADADKVYLVKIKFDDNMDYDFEEVGHLIKCVSTRFAEEGLHNIVIAETKGIEFEIYELEKEKKEK
jgi:hypothetical protein